MPARTFLLTWNPANPHGWKGDPIAEIAVRTEAGEPYVAKWSCGNNQSIKKDDRVFLMRQGPDKNGIVAAGTVTRASFQDQHWDPEKNGTAWFVETSFEHVVDPEHVMSISEFKLGPLASVRWSTQVSGISIADDAAEVLERLWSAHLERLSRQMRGNAAISGGVADVRIETSPAQPIPLIVGDQYTRQDVYELIDVPEEKRRGNWETGYNRWGDYLFVFATVGSSATGGFDYDNGWEGDVFRWYAKENTRLNQPLIQWILNDARAAFIFTRPATRSPFRFEGLGNPLAWEDRSPVLIRWRINRSPEGSFDFSAHGHGEGDWGIQSEAPESPQAFDLEPPPPNRAIVTTNRIIRDTALIRALKIAHANRCQICGIALALPDGRSYSEGHHIKPLGAPHHGPDVPANVLILCPNHHALCDLGGIGLDKAALSDPANRVAQEFIEYHNTYLLIVPVVRNGQEH